MMRDDEFGASGSQEWRLERSWRGRQVTPRLFDRPRDDQIMIIYHDPWLDEIVILRESTSGFRELEESRVVGVPSWHPKANNEIVYALSSAEVDHSGVRSRAVGGIVRGL